MRNDSGTVVPPEMFVLEDGGGEGEQGFSPSSQLSPSYQ